VPANESSYREGWGPRFAKAYRRYKNLRHRVDRKMGQVLADPYAGTERLGKVPGGMDLRGCRSIRVTRNFRIIFVVCEECRRVPNVSSASVKGCLTRPSSLSLSAPTSELMPFERN